MIGGAPLSPNDAIRRELAKAIGLLDIPTCPELTPLLEVVCDVLNVSVASIAMFYSGECWNMNAVSFPTGPMPWSTAMCPWHVMKKQAQTILCADLLDDARGTELVENGYRSYFSAPLVTANGHCIGSLCIVNHEPRSFDAGACRVLNNFGELAVRVLERYLGLAKRLHRAQQAVPSVLTQFEHAAGKSLDKNTAADQLLTNLYKRCFRNVDDTQDSCCLIVNTGRPRWPILYADNTWKLWTGFARSLALGRGLLDLLEPDGEGAAPINKEEWQRKANERKRFLKYGMKFVKPSHDSNILMIGTATDHEDGEDFVDGTDLIAVSEHETLIDKVGIDQKRKSIYLTFRPMALDLLDEQAIPVGVPPGAQMHVSTAMLNLYVVSLHGADAMKDASNNTEFQTFKSSIGDQICKVFPGLVLGDVLGKGGYGIALRGDWHGVQVVVKMQDQVVTEESAQALKNEISFGQRLRHPNIVSTLTHTKLSITGGEEEDVFKKLPDFWMNETDSLWIESSESSVGDQSFRVPGSIPTVEPYMLRNFIVLEYCDLGTLQEAVVKGWFKKRDTDGHVRADGPLDLKIVLNISQDIAAGCAYLHSNDIVHADLSGGNVLLSTPSDNKNASGSDSCVVMNSASGYTILDHEDKKRGMIAKISDFGKARDMCKSRAINSNGYATITHMAPEVLRDNSLSFAADVYALGVLIWQMMTGSMPFASWKRADIFQHVSTLKPGDPSGLVWNEAVLDHPEFTADEAQLARNIADLADKCMQCEPDRRPQMAFIEYQLRVWRGTSP